MSPARHARRAADLGVASRPAQQLARVAHESEEDRIDRQFFGELLDDFGLELAPLAGC